MTIIATIGELEAIYGQPNEASTVKVADRITPAYRALIDKSPFAALATCGPEGLDCSPRGDLPGFVRIHDVMTVEDIYFQCARAIVRADLWNPDKRVDPKALPTPGQILAEMSDNTVGGEKYDREWPERARQTM